MTTLKVRIRRILLNFQTARSIPWTVLIPVFTILLGYLSDQKHLGGIVLPTLKDKYGRSAEKGLD